MAYVPRLKEKYTKEVVPALTEKIQLQKPDAGSTLFKDLY